jgi:Restriction endonuclease
VSKIYKGLAGVGLPESSIVAALKRVVDHDRSTLMHFKNLDQYFATAAAGLNYKGIATAIDHSAPWIAAYEKLHSPLKSLAKYDSDVRQTAKSLKLLDAAHLQQLKGLKGVLDFSGIFEQKVDHWLKRVEWHRFEKDEFDQFCDDEVLQEQTSKTAEGAQVCETGILLPDGILQTLVDTKFFALRLMRAVLVKPEEMRHITHRQFEELIAELVLQMGFRDVVLTPRSKDGGRDVMCVLSSPSMPILHAIECKQWSQQNKVGELELRTLFGAINMRENPAAVGILATTSTFTRDALRFVATECRLGTKDFEQIRDDWIAPVRSRLTRPAE